MTYTIKHCKVRQRRGAPAWAVFRVEPSHDPEFFSEVLIGISAHATEAEAIAAKTALETL